MNSNNDSVKISLVQMDILWENPNENLKKLNKLLEKPEKDVEIVILPEMFSTGFTMNVHNLEHPIGKITFEWMKQKSKELNKILIGSILFEENNHFFNRMFWMPPDGNFLYYDKIHLFRMGGEHKVMTAGNKRTIVEHKGIKFLLQICYDLRFPMGSKNSYSLDKDEYAYDAIIYVANWPQSRKYAYMNLLKARAIENQAAVLWVNRVGTDEQGNYFSGDTQILNEKGEVLCKAEAGKEKILNYILEKNSIMETREKFKMGLDWNNLVF